MTVDIFDFWSVVGPTDHVHPVDVDVLARIQTGFDFLSLPACTMGPLRTAPIVLLYLSPGWSERDPEDAKSKAGQDSYMRRRAGDEPLPGPKESGFDWWVSRTKCFGNRQGLRSKIAVLNIGAYHSKAFVDAPLLAALPSSRVSIGWAQDILFPQAIAGKRLVVCLRSARFWGLSVRAEPFGRALFAPPATRGGHLKRGEVRDRIIQAAANVLQNSN